MVEPLKCPTCGAKAGIPIAYGYPGVIGKQAERGEVALGGCLIPPDAPGFHCTACGVDFGEFGDVDPMAYWDDQADADGEIHT